MSLFRLFEYGYRDTLYFFLSNENPRMTTNESGENVVIREEKEEERSGGGGDESKECATEVVSEQSLSKKS
jgi:hypothetical protein